MRLIASVAAAAILVLWTFVPVGAQGANVAAQSNPGQANTFEPKTLTVTPGTTVTWTFGPNPHSVTANDNSFDSHQACPPACSQGGTYQRTFNQAGSFGYYCKVHGTSQGGGMAGTITVQAQQATAAPTTPPPTAVRTTTAPRTAAPATATARATPTRSPPGTPPPTTAPAVTPSPTSVAPASPEAEDDGGGTPVLNILAIGLGAAAVIGAGIAGLTSYLRRTRPPTP